MAGCGCKADYSSPKQDDKHREYKSSRCNSQRRSLLYRARADDKTYDAKVESHEAVKVEYAGRVESCHGGGVDGSHSTVGEYRRQGAASEPW